MLQTNQQFLCIDRAIKMAFVNPAADGQGHHGRGLPAILRDPLEHWGLPFGSPGKANRFGVGQPKFIFKDDFDAKKIECASFGRRERKKWSFKDDFGAEPPRFFLSAANPCPTRLGSILHPAQWRGDLASVHSSPNHAASD